jgi:hypothetical protein
MSRIATSGVRIVQWGGCPDMTAYNDFTTEAWTKKIGIFEGNIEANMPLSFINPTVEPTRLAIDGGASNEITPYTGAFDLVVVQATTVIPISFFGDCNTLTATGTWRQPSLVFDPAADPTPPNCPLRPPTGWNIYSNSGFIFHTDSSTIYKSKTRQLFADRSVVFCEESTRHYHYTVMSDLLTNTPSNGPATGLDEDWEQTVDLSLRDPGDTTFTMIFTCSIFNEAFQPGVAFNVYYPCAAEAVTEIYDVSFTLEP